MRVGKNWHRKFFDPAFYTPASPEARERAPEEVRFAMRAMGLKKTNSLLDVACGPGRHSLEFARRGLAVTGFDFSEHYLAEARADAKRLGLGANFMRGDMRKLPFIGGFDAAVCMFTSFGYFDRKSDSAVLKGVARALRAGGKFLLDVIDRDWLYANERPKHWEEFPDGTLFLEESSLDKKRRVAFNRWITVPPGGKPIGRRFALRLYNKRDISTALRKAGLKPLKFWSSFEKTRTPGNRLIVLAEKI
ncbi:MAG: class I SAM-dependent methyltransferase [Elusimicrobiales bacterium]|nr:class I SAM-dependent methyltransferase [Elusimicrobiales bacterium]